MHDHSKYQYFVRSHLQEIDGAFQNKSCFMKVEDVGDFLWQFSSQQNQLFFFSSLAHISIHMVYFSLVQLPVYSFPNWNGNTDISVPTARPSYSASALNIIGCVFFLSFLLTTNTIDYRFWKQSLYLVWP